MSLPEFRVTKPDPETKALDNFDLHYPNKLDLFEGNTFLQGAAVNYDLLMNTPGVDEAISDIFARELKLEEGLSYLGRMIDVATMLIGENALVVPPQITFSEAMAEIAYLYVGIPEEYVLYKPLYERRIQSPVSSHIDTSFSEDLLVTDFSKDITIFMSKFRKLPGPNWFLKYLEPDEIVKRAQAGTLEESRAPYEVSHNRYYYQINRRGLRSPLGIIHGKILTKEEQYYHILEVKKVDYPSKRLYHFMNPIERES